MVFPSLAIVHQVGPTLLSSDFGTKVYNHSSRGRGKHVESGSHSGLGTVLSPWDFYKGHFTSLGTHQPQCPGVTAVAQGPRAKEAVWLGSKAAVDMDMQVLNEGQQRGRGGSPKATIF
jgi:hypothetical protein